VFDRSGAGLGFGASVADATYRALFSAVGHLALQLAIRGTTRAAVIDHGLEADPELTFLTHCARDIGAEVELLRLEAGGRLPVLLARARDGAGRPLWSVGADQSPDRAAKIALRDVIGQHQVLAQREADLDLGHRLLASFDPYTIKPAASEPLGAVPPQPVGDLLGSLRDAGHEAYALLDDSPDLRQAGLRAVRVLLTVTERA